MFDTYGVSISRRERRDGVAQVIVRLHDVRRTRLHEFLILIRVNRSSSHK